MKDTRTVLDVARDREAFNALLGKLPHTRCNSIPELIRVGYDSGQEISIVLAFLLEREWQRSEIGR